MSRLVDQKELVVSEQLVAAPEQRSCEDQSFEMPTGIYVAMGLLFIGFISVLAAAFHGRMGVSFAIIFAFLAAFFAIPVIFVKAAPDGGVRALDWSRFRDFGIGTATGRTEAGAATALVLVLPFLILCFSIAIALIAALVH